MEHGIIYRGREDWNMESLIKGGQGELQVYEQVAERTRDVATAALHRRVVRGIQDVWTETRNAV